MFTKLGRLALILAGSASLGACADGYGYSGVNVGYASGGYYDGYYDEGYGPG